MNKRGVSFFDECIYGTPSCLVPILFVEWNCATPPFLSSAFCLLVAPCQAIDSKHLSSIPRSNSSVYVLGRWLTMCLCKCLLPIAWQGATSKQKALDGNGGVMLEVKIQVLFLFKIYLHFFEQMVINKVWLAPFQSIKWIWFPCGYVIKIMKWREGGGSAWKGEHKGGVTQKGPQWPESVLY